MREKKLSVLAVGAHPDDVEYSAGGTVAKYAKAGHKVTILNLTRGGAGSMRLSSEELKRTRTEEGIRAGKILGADVKYMPDIEGFQDGGGLIPSHENVLAVVDVVREIKPDIIISHHTNEIHPDDRAAGLIMRDVFTVVALPLVKTKHPAHSVSDLYMYGDIHRFTELPTSLIFIDIEDTIDLKIKALAEHKSQMDWLTEHKGYDAGMLDPVEEIKAQARALGYRCGIRYAEAFVPLKPKALDFFPYYEAKK
ncbi:MAG: PIG-L family deacetylase [Candidatus Bathyarchaeia archaeon]